MEERKRTHSPGTPVLTQWRTTNTWESKQTIKCTEFGTVKHCIKKARATTTSWGDSGLSKFPSFNIPGPCFMGLRSRVSFCLLCWAGSANWGLQTQQTDMPSCWCCGGGAGFSGDSDGETDASSLLCCTKCYFFISYIYLRLYGALLQTEVPTGIN